MSVLDFLFDDETAVSGLKTLTDSVKSKASGSNNVWFRYRNLDFGASCTIRFLPAGPENMAGQFWLPRKVVRLKFADPVNVGQDVNITIPVLQMYTGGKPSDDLVLGQATRLYEQAKALEEKGETEKAKQVRGVAKTHYIRGEAIAQCFVVTPGFMEQDPPENPVRLIELNKQIINVISAKINTDNPEMKLDYWPCHGKKGHNFVIKKSRTADGKYPKWDDGTGFSARVTPWTDEQKAGFDKHGFWDLTQFLPARPGEDEYKLLAEIVSQSVNGDRVWNPDWEAHLSAAKVFRSQQAGDEEAETTTLHEQVHQALSGSKPAAAATAADVVSSLSRTASTHDAEPVEDTVEPNADDGMESATTGDDIRNIVARMKKQQIKTATPE